MAYEISYATFNPSQVVEGDTTTLAVVLKTPVDTAADPNGTDVTLQWSVDPPVAVNTLIDTPFGPAPTTIHIPANFNGVVLQVKINPHIITAESAVVKVVAFHPSSPAKTTLATLQVLKENVFVTHPNGREPDAAGLHDLAEEIDRVIEGKQLPISVKMTPIAAEGQIAITDALSTVLELQSTLNLPQEYSFRVGVAFTVNKAEDNSIVPIADFFQGNPRPPFFFTMQKDDVRVHSLRPQLLTGTYFVTITSTVAVPTLTGGKEFVHAAKVVKVVGK